MSASWKALADNHTCGDGFGWFMSCLSFSQYKNNAELGSGVGVWYFYNYLCKILIESYRIAGFLQVQQPAVVIIVTCLPPRKRFAGSL